MEELALSCYGVDISLDDASGLGLCQQLRDTLPPEFAPPIGRASAAISYAVTAATPPGAGYRVTRDGVDILTVSAESADDLLRWFHHDIDVAVSRRSRQMLFVHAGVVGWRGVAIVIPGPSLSGKSTLVEALVRRGATYYSDAFAVLDGEGMVHSYAKGFDLPDDGRPLRDLRLEWAGAPRAPLPMRLIVTGPYQPDAVWRPAVLLGSQAVSPLIDNVVLAQDEPEWTMQVAARVASTVVTLQGPRPDAEEAVAVLLDLIDTACASRAPDTDERPSGITADLAGVAETRFASQIPGPSSTARRLEAARYVRITDFLSPEDHRHLLDRALTSKDPLEEVWDLFEGRLRAMLPAVRRELGMAWFPLGEVGRQLTTCAGFSTHSDTNAVAATRRVACVYHFYASPRRFTGGELRLYDTWVTDTGSVTAPSYTTAVPIDNSIVFFSSATVREVCPVQPESEALRDSLFAVTIWFHEDASTATFSGASDSLRPAVGPWETANLDTSPRTEDHLLRRAALMRNRGIDVVLDVGANKGQFGFSLREDIGYRGRIVSFEPLSDAYADLRRMAAQDAAWACHNFALGEENGSETINVSANSHSSSFLPVNEHSLEIEPSIGYIGRETVELRRLDDVFAEVVRPGETPYLKIDAQGYEVRILRGGLGVLERFPLMQLETSFIPVYKDEPLIGDVIQFLASLGFRVVSFEPGWDDPRTGEMLQADLIFART